MIQHTVGNGLDRSINQQPQHCLHLYFGENKGKTTAAMGLALRALGHHRRVLVAQFLKTGTSGELAALRTFPEATVFDVEPVRGFVFQMTEAQREETRRAQTAQVGKLLEIAAREKPELTVLDELAVCVFIGIVEESAAWALIRECLKYGDVAVTGRDAPASFLEQADYVTEMKKHRHPFDKGVKARKGIEF